MEYIVPMSKMEKYLRLEIGDNGLFPEEAPIGTSFYDLVPENNIRCIVKKDHINNLLTKFVNKEIDDNRVKEYVETLIALDLFEFDETNESDHDLISNAVFTLDELKDVNGIITISDAREILNKLK